MFDFLKRKKNTPELEPSVEPTPAPTPPAAATTTDDNFFSRLKQGLAKTRHTFTASLSTLFLGKKELTPAVISEIETILLMADVGVETTEHLINLLSHKLARKELNDTAAALVCLQAEKHPIL